MSDSNTSESQDNQLAEHIRQLRKLSKSRLTDGIFLLAYSAMNTVLLITLRLSVPVANANAYEKLRARASLYEWGRYCHLSFVATLALMGLMAVTAWWMIAVSLYGQRAAIEESSSGLASNASMDKKRYPGRLLLEKVKFLMIPLHLLIGVIVIANLGDVANRYETYFFMNSVPQAPHLITVLLLIAGVARFGKYILKQVDELALLRGMSCDVDVKRKTHFRRLLQPTSKNLAGMILAIVIIFSIAALGWLPKSQAYFGWDGVSLLDDFHQNRQNQYTRLSWSVDVPTYAGYIEGDWLISFGLEPDNPESYADTVTSIYGFRIGRCEWKSLENEFVNRFGSPSGRRQTPEGQTRALYWGDVNDIHLSDHIRDGDVYSGSNWQFDGRGIILISHGPEDTCSAHFCISDTGKENEVGMRMVYEMCAPAISRANR
ncbi:MAG: hypothetical protein JW936_06020 [Sedimentisphaerales bacterium]|nr:hypothetical protein [Sedimentisphaerales bacterium]